MAKPRLQKKEPHRSLEKDVPGSGGALRWESMAYARNIKVKKPNTAGEGHSDLCMVRLTGLERTARGSCQDGVWICMEVHLYGTQESR